MTDRNFWKKKKVFITGHTGFKGAWLCLWLHSMGSTVYGYALKPPTNPSIFELCRLDRLVHSTTGDVRDEKSLSQAMLEAEPEIVIHMAAQPLVREAYKIPKDTYDINVLGTVNLFEAVRTCKSVRAVINVTTDKCYENREWVWGYRENEPLGGFDPYSSSKACSELVTAAYRSSYFNPKDHAAHRTAIATARAGNVIGGGDWAADRLIPDCVRAMMKGETVVLRNPEAIRPWQHVLEPLSGYLILAQKLYEDGSRFADAWNFGPCDDSAKSVAWVVQRLCDAWGKGATYTIDIGKHPHESHLLKLDSTKSRLLLGWQPRWSIERTIDSIAEWMHAYQEGKDIAAVCLGQIEQYTLRREDR